MKDYPILFNDEMVRAILDGRKTQTRRPVKLLDPSCTYSVVDDSEDEIYWPYDSDEAGVWHRQVGPFGGPGDRLWVRECCRYWDNSQPSQDSTWEASVRYRANNGLRNVTAMIEDCPEDIQLYEPSRWWPSIYMPKWACRTFLPVIDVRVERIQDITRDDALAEGVDLSRDLFPTVNSPDKALKLFPALWDAIYATKGLGWDDNPWVWVCSFRGDSEVITS